MSYCRFTNTLADLRDCYDNMDEPLHSSEEETAKRRLIKLCQSIVDDYASDASDVKDA